MDLKRMDLKTDSPGGMSGRGVRRRTAKRNAAIVA